MPEKKHRPLKKSKFLFAGVILVLSALLMLHKPLPPGFCAEKSVIDRIIIHVFEPVLRAVYYYPAHQFSDPLNQIWWTRLSLNTLARTLGPIKLFDRSIISQDDTWHGVKVRYYQPRNLANSTGAAVVFIHGGGFAIGSVEMYDGLTWRMARQMNTFVVSIDYRLSPESVFPENLLDCEKAVNYLFENAEKYRIDPKKVVLIGDSAGGNLATAITQRRVLSRQEPQIAAQILIYPLLQLVDLQTLSYRFFHENLDGFAFVGGYPKMRQGTENAPSDPASVAFYYMMYAGIPAEKAKELVPVVLSNGHIKENQLARIEQKLSFRSRIEVEYAYNNTKIAGKWEIQKNEEAQRLLEPFLFDPDFSPIMRESLENLPKSLIITCEYDTLRDEGIIYAEKLKAAGVPTTLINYKNGYHAMLNMHNEITEASECVEDVIRWIGDQVLARNSKN